MSYMKADKVLPRELVEAIQEYVDGKLLYIPRKEKHRWGSETAARKFFRERNERIYAAHEQGVSISDLSRGFALSKKSIQRILREQRRARR